MENVEAQAEAPEVITPELIAHAFVSQYYSILHQTPELVHRFYQDTSTMSRPAQDGSVKTVSTMKDINDLIVSLDCKDYKAEILTADAQASYKEGVTVLVTGCLTGKDNVRRKFTESFFLAPQSNGYYVLNDAFRFIEEELPPAVTSVEVKESGENPAALTVAKEPELVEVLAAVEPVSDGSADVSDKSNEQLIVEESVVSDPPVEHVNHVDDRVVVESSSDMQDTPKKSYASILKDRKDSMRTTPVSVPSTAKTSATNNGHQTHGTTASVPRPQANGTAPPAGQQLKETANPAVVPESPAPNGNIKHANNTDKKEEKGYSIYIGNLPYDAAVDQVEQEFKKFGPIKRGGVQVRCTKGFCFGFVEFENFSSVQKAIEASPVQMGGYEAFVEEKKTSTRVVNGVSTFSSGRGGYRNDGFRGRGNFSGGRGYGRNDYGRRGGDYGNGGRGDYGNVGRGGDYGNGGRGGEYGNRPRSGDGYHRNFQNGGGRPIRQGGPK